MHFFCKSDDLAKKNLQRLHDIVNDNSTASGSVSKAIEVLNECISQCKDCLKYYKGTEIDRNFEKTRLLVNFNPDEIYDWRWLLDSDILKEYAMCISYPTIYQGFKAIVYLVSCNIKNEETWKRVDLSEELFENQERGFFLENDSILSISFLKGIRYYLECKRVDPGPLVDFISIIKRFQVEKREKERDLEIFKCIMELFKRTTKETIINELKELLMDIINTMDSDILINNLDNFEKLGLKQEVFQGVHTFDLKVVKSIIMNIKSIDISKFITNENVRAFYKALANGRVIHASCQADTECFNALINSTIISIYNSNSEIIKDLPSYIAGLDWRNYEEMGTNLLYFELFFGEKVEYLPPLKNHKYNIIKAMINDIPLNIIDRRVFNVVLCDMEYFIKSDTSNTLSDRFSIIIARNFQLTVFDTIKFIEIFKITMDVMDLIISKMILSRIGLKDLVLKLKKLGEVYLEKIQKVAVNLPREIQEIISNAYSDEGLELKEENHAGIKKIQIEIKNLSHNKTLDELDKKRFVLNYFENLLGLQPSISKLDISTLETSLEGDYDFLFRIQPMTQKKQDEITKKISNRFSNYFLLEKNIAAMEEHVKKSGDKCIKETSTKTKSLSVNEGEAIIIDSRFPDKDLEARVLFKSSKLFSNKKIKTVTENGSVFIRPAVDTIEFYEECVNLNVPFYQTENMPIDGYFESYQEYFSYFNALRANENKYTVINALATLKTPEKVKLESFGEYARISADSLIIEINDLIYLSENKETSGDFNCSNLNNNFSLPSSQLSVKPPSNGIIGIVMKSFISESTNNKIVDLWISPIASKKLIPGRSVYASVFHNITTAFREFQALIKIKESPLLPYLLWPSYRLDLKNRDTSWDSNELKIISQKSRRIPIVSNSNFYWNSACELFNNESIELIKKYHKLNESQAFSVILSLTSNEKLVLIQGPPGTGKTTTILSLVATALLLRDTGASKTLSSKPHPKFKILICAPSNTAIDIVVERLSNGCYNFIGEYFPIFPLRIGYGSSPGVNPYTLEYLVSKLNNQSRSKARHELISTSQVICTTLNSSASDFLSDVSFDLVIIDEACQSIEPSVIIPFQYNPKKIIMIGDPCQLPPTVISNQKPLEKSLFERLSIICRPLILQTQYRMHPEICKISSHFFYFDKIQTSEELQKLYYDEDSKYKGFKCTPPVNFIEIPSGNESVDKSKSYFNLCEVGVCIEICKKLHENMGSDISIAILSPYKAQVAELIKRKSQLSRVNVKISTIDAFQGHEADVVIFSTVRQQGMGFITDQRRINVAITRSKRCLIILGNSHCLNRNSTWKDILSHISTKCQYFKYKNRHSLLKMFN